jgi:hypothetical protein
MGEADQKCLITSSKYKVTGGKITSLSSGDKDHLYKLKVTLDKQAHR